MSVDSSGYVIVTLPLSSTSTLVPSGKLSLLASSILSLISSFSLSVRLSLSPTSVFPGTVGSIISEIGSSGLSSISGSPCLYWNTRFSAGIVSFDSSGYVIVALPLSSTSTFVPSGNLSLLASSILFLTSSFSLSVNFSGSFTPVFSGIVGSVLSAVVLGFESLSFGSVPFSFSVLSSTPSLSSSVSVTSGVPSPSASLKIVTVISFVDSFPASSTALIVAVIVFSSLSPQSSAFGIVPSICLVSGLYFNPSGKSSTVTFALTSSTSTITGGIGCPSTAVTLPASIVGVVVSPETTFSQTAENITLFSPPKISLLNGLLKSNSLSVPNLTHFTNLYPSLVGSVTPLTTSPSFTVTF